MDPRVEKMADVIVNYSTGVKHGDWVAIRAPLLAEPMADAIVRAVLKAGGRPSVHFQSSTIAESILREGSDDQIGFVPPTTTTLIEGVDVSIGILAPSNTRALTGIDPTKMGVQNKAFTSLNQTFMRRWQQDGLRWTGLQFPTEASAQDAGMSLRDYEDFVFGAGLLDRDDPVAAWQELGKNQQRLIDWLQDKSEVHITGPDTDLRVNIAGRSWRNDDGHANFPGGEIFTGPEESSTQGVIQFNFPAVYQGREITNIRLKFEAGRAVDASASSEEAYLHEMLDMDEGARRLGEFAFGTNPGIQTFSRNTLFDEKISGTLHMALGFSIPGTGVNTSALHWDMVYNLRVGTEVTVDGQLFLKDGEFTV